VPAVQDMKKQKPVVLLVDKIHPTYLAKLERCARVVRPDAYDEESLAALAEKEQIDAMIIRTRGCVTEKILRASPNLKIVGRHGIGVDHIDIDAATRAGIWVVNTPEGSRVAVAEHTWAMILALAKNGPRADRAVRTGDFPFRERCKSIELRGKTLGVIGLGRIGTTVADIGKRAFGMNIIYTDILKFPAKEKRLGATKVTLKKLLASSQVVTLHTPLDASTEGMIGAEQLSWMRPETFLINCARGAIVDGAALASALKSGTIAGAGLDVFVPEEPPLDHPLMSCENAIFAPHSAAQTPEANLAYAEVVNDILLVLSGKAPKFPLNKIKRKK